MFVRQAVVASVTMLTLSMLSAPALAQQPVATEAGPVPEPGEAPPPAPTSPEDVERALQLYDEARGLYSAGKYDDAVARLTEAVNLDPAAGMLFYNLGLIEEKVGQLDAARGHYQRALELSEDEPERLKLAKIIKRLEGAQQTKDPPAPKPDPGGESVEPTSTPADATRSGVSPWVYVTAATAGVGVILGAVFASRAAALDPGDELVTGEGISVADLQADAATAHDFAVGADVAFIIGGAAAVASIVIAIVLVPDPPDSSALHQPAGQLELGPRGAQMVWRF
jgi:tetratricopeptide (TPR) repeat protein